MTKEAVIQYIKTAPVGGINELCDLIMNKKEENYPQWEMLYVALEKDRAETCRRTLAALRAYLRRKRLTYLPEKWYNKQL